MSLKRSNNSSPASGYMCVGRMLDWGELEITGTKDDDERHSARPKIGI